MKQWLAVAALMAGFYLVDRALARLETREVSAEAQDHYREGQQLLASGRAAAAVDAFRHAHTLERTDRKFDIALANAELTAGSPESAEQTLGEVLNRNSNDGRANLLMARVRLSQRAFDDAVAFYHRAIYGAWPDGSAADQRAARLELADQLARHGRHEELLSELLLLEGSAQSDPVLAKRVAALFLQAGAAARAEEAYRNILRQHPEDTGAFEGLGDVALSRGEYRVAHAAFLAVAKLQPEDKSASRKVQLADRLNGLDPTSRYLVSTEKFRRSQEILSMAEGATLDCLKDQAMPAALHDLLAQSGKLRAQKIAAPSNEASESRLELAEQIWKARLEFCPVRPAADDPLSVLMTKLEQ